MKEDKNNVLTDKEKEEYQKLKGLEKFGKLVGKELSEENKKKLGKYRKRLGELLGDSAKGIEDKERIPQELRQYRKALEKYTDDVSKENKEKIIQTVEKIPINVEIENDGSRIIEFSLGNKTYKILDPKLETHTDNNQCRYGGYYEYGKEGSDKYVIDRGYVTLQGMAGDNIKEWENKKLKKYVQQKQREGFHIAKIEEIQSLLKVLGEQVKLNKQKDQIVALMYLTGMHGEYRLTMDEHEENIRNILECSFLSYEKKISRRYNGSFGTAMGNICMIASED